MLDEGVSGVFEEDLSVIQSGSLLLHAFPLNAGDGLCWEFSGRGASDDAFVFGVTCSGHGITVGCTTLEKVDVT